MRFLMKFLKTVLIIFTVAIAGFSLIQKTSISETPYYQKIFPCSRPLKYSIGSVDPKFEISQEELILLAQEAESIWNKALNKDILKYEENAEFKINLIFDERQEQTLEAEKLNQDLKKLEISHDTLLKEYDSLSEFYKQKFNAYNEAVDEYEDDLKDYNKEVDYWNEKGGISEDEYDRLKKEKKNLEKEYKNLEKRRTEVNNLANKTNNLTLKENQIVNTYNDSLNTYKSEFGDSREFEKGRFSGKEINIYQFKKASDLRLTLIHEMGHYLGLEHVENSKSIMYYLIGDQNLDIPALTEEDLTELKKICGLH